MAWQTPWAPTDAELGACVECGLCLPHCPTFRLTGDEAASPRGRINAMRAVASDVAVMDEVFDEVMSFCLQCRACEAACPSLAPFGRMMEGARAELAELRPRSRRWRTRLTGRWLRRRWAVRLATLGVAVVQRTGAWLVPRRLQSGLHGMRRLAWRRRSVLGYDSGSGSSTVGLLAGCVMDPWFTRVHEATIALLEAAGYRVMVPDRQTCCGALAAHEGAAAEAADMASRNARAFGDVDHVIANAAGCSAHLGAYGHWGAVDVASRALDAIVLVDRAIEDGRLAQVAPTGDSVAVQDPCHHRHAQRILAEPRRILRAAGLGPIDVDSAGMCCGAAGAYSVMRPETSRRLGEAKAEEVGATGAPLVASANPGCEMQLRAFLGDGTRVAHPLEIYAEALGLIPRWAG